MNLKLTEEQEMLKKMARDFLIDKFPKRVVKELEASESGYSPDIWKEMAELGWMGLVFPEKYGGADMSFLDLAVLLEEMGRACLPGPYFSAVILGGLPILDIGSEEQKQEYLPKIASGEAIFTLALTEPSARYDATAIQTKTTANKDAYILNGTKLFVPYANVADHMLVVARTDGKAKAEDGTTIFILDANSPGISTTVLRTIANNKLCEVILEQVKVLKENILGELNHGWNEVQKIILWASVGTCCDMVGGMQKVMEMTIDYAKEREQFDHPIGSFQAVQHFCANMASDVQTSGLITRQAAWMLSKGLGCTKEVAMAKWWVGEAYERVIALSHQIHGGVGFTMDHDLQLYTRRGKSAQYMAGDVNYNLEIVAQQMGL